ncbi:hypothetical protein Tco_0941196 [Tanacetum coccineum]|uniref:Uncharacterized protein n=1 Tax=Tanacetum coccineum TaxID=301880 RepID=A0ABQ5DQ75_9ASTR
MTSPSPSPPISLSPPYIGERLARCTAPPALSSPPPVPSPLLPSSGCPTQIQTLRIASIQALIDAVTAALPSPPLPPLPPSLYIPPPVDHRNDLLESEQPPRKRLCLSTLSSKYEVGESSTARPTGDPAETVPKITPMTVGEVNTRFTELAELHEHDTQDLYALLKDAQDGWTRISQRVAMDSQRVDLLMGDMMTLQETVWIVEEEAYASREAWAHSIGLSQATHHELQTHRDHMQQAKMAALRETDRRRQAQMAETLRVMRDMRREMSDIQVELLAHREQQRRAR